MNRLLPILLIVALAAPALAAALVTTSTYEPCVPFDVSNVQRTKDCLSHQIGTSRTIPNPKGVTVPANGLCPVGYHKIDNFCHPNTSYCSDESYDKDTYNCFHCKWYAFQVQGDMTHFPKFTGDYCQTSWWWFTFLLLLLLLTLFWIIALLWCFFCQPKAKKARAPAPKKQEVHVQAERVHHPAPVRVEHRVERGEPREHRGHPVVTEHRAGRSYGQGVHVETRTYSPNREVQRVSHGHEDWAKWSHANWQGH
jgi:hypothetical protein